MLSASSTRLLQSSFPLSLRVPANKWLHCRFYISSPQIKDKKRTDHAQHKQMVIERKRAYVDQFMKQGLVKKATDLVHDLPNGDELEGDIEGEDPFYTIPPPSGDDDGEREYITFEEDKKNKKRRTKEEKQVAKEEWEAEMENWAEREGEEEPSYKNSYKEWCTYYEPMFKTKPYSLGYQVPDQMGNYTWSHALDTANQMVFGHEKFRPLQLEALNASLRGEDVFLSLPTGGGKSLCFWLRALLSPGITIVISPLVALIHDQLQKLTSRGIPVLRLDSSTKSSAMKALKRDELPYKLIYITPERMRSIEFLDIFRNLYVKDMISLVAIDEAHCISEWGHDFRPSYRRLGIFREEFPNIPIMAMTATATHQVQKDILESLYISDTASVFESSFNRPNLYYEVRPKVMVVDDIAHLLSSERFNNESGIIYCLTKNESQELADQLRERGIHASPYHSSMGANIRAKIQDAWKKGSIKVLCTTTAFGLGVDKGNIRYVIHHTVPLSLEAYYQQTGRAGRDGQPSTCILYYAQADCIRAAKMLAAVSSNSPNAPTFEDSEALFESGSHMGVKVDLMDNVITYCSEEKKCRREILLAYFGEKIHRSACGNTCDNCQRLLAAKNKLQKPQDTSTKSPSLSPPAPDTAPSTFIPPPPVATLHPRTYTSFTSREVRAEIRSEERQKAKEGEEEDDEEFDMEEDEDMEKLPPLERLKRRRQLRKELKNAKHFHPPSKDAAPLYFDRMTKAKNKKYDQIRRAMEDKKEAAEARRAQYHAAKFSPESDNKDKDKEVEYTSARNTNKFAKPPKLNKTGKVNNDTSNNIPTTPEKKPFGNSFRNPNKEKLNKTGKITPTNNNETQEDERPSPGNPKQLMAVVKKFNSLQFKSNKLNKTGKIVAEETNNNNNNTKRLTPKPLPRYGNSLRYPAKEKLNKTGKIQETEGGEGEGEGEERITYTTRFKPPPKLNKTGKIENKESEEEVVRTARPFKKEKPNKTGRIQADASPSLSSSPLSSPSLSYGTDNSPKEKFNLREHLTRLQAANLVNSSSPLSSSSSSSSSPDSGSAGAASAALHIPSKADATLTTLKQVYTDISKEASKGKEGKKNEFFTDNVMMRIWTTKPTSILELTSIPGVGSSNAAKYAEKLLPLFRSNK